MKVLNIQPKRLKICCSFSKWTGKGKVNSQLEKELIELFWFDLGVRGKLCKNCTEYGQG